MPVKFISSSDQVDEAISESVSTPVIIHYWDPSMGEESSFLYMFLGAEEQLGPLVSFYIVDSGYVHPPHEEDEMPLTVLYDNGEEREIAFFDEESTNVLISQASRVRG